MKIIDYVCVVGDGLEDLNENVSSMLAQGWQPLGGIAAAMKDAWDRADLFQAMVKYE